MTTAAIVTVRATSSRLPGKCLLPITPDANAIQLVIRRARLTGLPVVMATSTDPSDDPLARIAEQEGIAVFRGSLLNKICRWRDLAIAHGVENLVMVDGDDLAFDPAIGRRAADFIAAEDEQADRYVPPADVVCGLFTAAYTRAGLDKLYQTAPDPKQDTDVLDHFIAKAGLVTAELPLEAGERDRTVRLTLDYPEDAEFFRALYARLAWDAAGPEIVRVALDEGLWSINWARQQDYLNNQANFTKRLST